MPLSRKNPHVQSARALGREVSARAAEGRFLLEGGKLIREALAAGVGIVEVFLSPAASARDEGLAGELSHSRIPLLEVDDDTLADLTGIGISQGAVAVAVLPGHGGAEALLEGEGDLLLAATIQDPGNAGALVRIAAAAGFAGVVADTGTADFFAPKAVRGSAGAILRLPAFRVEDLAEFAGQFAWKGGMVLGAVPRGGEAPGALVLPQRVALVLGSEGRGLPPALDEACSARVTIPMAGKVESLNVASAAAILAFEIRKHRE